MSSTIATTDGEYEPVLTAESCPWCLYPAEQFREYDDGSVGCEHCHACIPVEADWYQEGQKIVV